jgi:Kef-type K+ transport system membrane component KefB
MDALTTLAVTWFTVYLAVIAAERTKLTPVLYFLAFGCLLVNVGILPYDTDPFIRGFAEIGIILIMFALGFEENQDNFIRGVKSSWGIAFFGAVFPFCTAYMLADIFWGDGNVSMMAGLAMTATAVSLTMVSLKGEGLSQTRAATGIMTSAVLDDIASLALVAILVPIATGAAVPSVIGMLAISGKAVLFFVLLAVVSVWILPHPLSGRMSRFPLLNKLGVWHVLSISDGRHATLTVLFMALIVGLLAHYFGFHPAIGAYMAGLILKEEYFLFGKDQDRNFFEETRAIVDNAAFSWIGPVFFVTLGTHILFDWEIMLSVIPQSILMTVALIVIQVASAGLAARFTAKFSWPDSLLIGCGMLGRAELAFVVLDIAYVQHRILSTEAFYVLMFSAFWMNVMVPVSISGWKRYFDREPQSESTSI